MGDEYRDTFVVTYGSSDLNNSGIIQNESILQLKKIELVNKLTGIIEGMDGNLQFVQSQWQQVIFLILCPVENCESHESSDQLFIV